MLVLIVDDEVNTAQLLKEGLKQEGYTAETSYSGKSAIKRVREKTYNAIFLDARLPDIDGFTVVRTLREERVTTPIIMLSNLADTGHKIKGLDAGADDYMTKPFDLKEVLARMRAVLRRPTACQAPVLTVGDLTLDPASHAVTRGKKRIRLTNKEYQILEYLMRRPGRVCTRTMIADHVWGFDRYSLRKSRVVDTTIGYLRKKIDRGRKAKLIQTVRYSGYVIEA
jgi:DNA-binding response OmpR family regulator